MRAIFHWLTEGMSPRERFTYSLGCALGFLSGCGVTVGAVLILTNYARAVR